MHNAVGGAHGTICTGEMRIYSAFQSGKALGRLYCKYESNIKVDIKEILIDLD
jgi:hypothetical protein